MAKEMRVYNSIEQFCHYFNQDKDNRKKPLVATIGFFDGVHLGHRKLMQTTRKEAERLGGTSLVITFDRHPQPVIDPNKRTPFVLSSLDGKIRYISEEGIDHLIILHFTIELAQQEAAQFMKPLIDNAGLQSLVLGYDNRFGKRHSDITREQFDADIRSWGIKLTRIEPLIIEGQTVSSSMIRKLVTHCKFDEAEKFLGRPFSFLGHVGHGAKIGRTIGYPTANIIPLDPMIFLPSIGIYISEVRLGDKIYPAMSYYGDRPTIDHSHLLKLEAFLLDFEGDLYGEYVEIGFRQYLRGDRKFDDLKGLMDQLVKDEEATRSYFSKHPLTLPHPKGIAIEDLREE